MDGIHYSETDRRVFSAVMFPGLRPFVVLYLAQSGQICGSLLISGSRWEISLSVSLGRQSPWLVEVPIWWWVTALANRA